MRPPERRSDPGRHVVELEIVAVYVPDPAVDGDESVDGRGAGKSHPNGEPGQVADSLSGWRRNASCRGLIPSLIATTDHEPCLPGDGHLTR